MDYPHTIAALRSLGKSRAEQAKAIGYTTEDSVILFERRLPRLLRQLASAPSGAVILRALLVDIDTKQKIVYDTSVTDGHAANDASASGETP